jgi:hypothetical protein
LESNPESDGDDPDRAAPTRSKVLGYVEEWRSDAQRQLVAVAMKRSSIGQDSRPDRIYGERPVSNAMT